MGCCARSFVGFSVAVAAAGALTPADARAEPPPAPGAAATALVPVHVDAPEDVVIEAQDASGSWQPVCESPCDKPLPASGYYRVNGSGIRTSRPFRIQPGSKVRLEVETTSSAAHASSIVIVVIGGAGLVPVAAVTGGWLTVMLFSVILVCPLVDAFSHTSYGGCLGDASSAVGQYYTRPYVWIPALAGVAMVAGGSALLVSTPPTRVTPSAAGPTGRAPEWTKTPLDALGVRSPPPVFELTF